MAFSVILISSPHLIVVRRRHLDSYAFPETTSQALHDQDQHDFSRLAKNCINGQFASKRPGLSGSHIH
jgi:hypothetical protein